MNKGTKEKLAKLELFGDNSQSSGDATVKQECPQFPELQKNLEALRSFSA